MVLGNILLPDNPGPIHGCQRNFKMLKKALMLAPWWYVFSSSYTTSSSTEPISSYHSYRLSRYHHSTEFTLSISSFNMSGQQPQNPDLVRQWMSQNLMSVSANGQQAPYPPIDPRLLAGKFFGSGELGTRKISDSFDTRPTSTPSILPSSARPRIPSLSSSRTKRRPQIG